MKFYGGTFSAGSVNGYWPWAGPAVNDNGKIDGR